MPPFGALDEEQHHARASHHTNVGDVLTGQGEDGWAATCYFYAAYHIVRAAMIADPIFGDPSRLVRVDVELTMQDRYTNRHRGRKRTSNGREWGVNELVALLYPSIVRPYEKLHQASIDVRYGRGLRAGAPQVRAVLEQIEEAAAAGRLVAS